MAFRKLNTPLVAKLLGELFHQPKPEEDEEQPRMVPVRNLPRKVRRVLRKGK